MKTKTRFILMVATIFMGGAAFGTPVTFDFTGNPFQSYSSSFTLDETVDGVAGVDTIQLTADNATSGGAASTFFPASGNGIAIEGGNNDAWFEGDETFDLTSTLYNGGVSGTDVTDSFDTSIVQMGKRWGGPFTMTGGTGEDNVFDDFPENTSTSGLDNPYLVDGNAITFSRTSTGVCQVGSITYEVIPEPATIGMLLGLGTLITLFIRRKLTA